MLNRVGFCVLFLSLIPAATQAEVYCRAAGIPHGCVVRPHDAGAPGVGVAPGVGRRSTRRGCRRSRLTAVDVAPAVGAPGVGVTEGPGVGVNRGGPVNRAGTR